MLSVLAFLIGLLGAPNVSGNVALNVSPSNATVKVDGKVIKGFKSGRAFQVSPGRHTLQVTGQGYKADKRSITVKKGQTLRLKVSLSKATGGMVKAPIKVRPKTKGPLIKTPSKKKPAAKAPAKGVTLTPGRKAGGVATPKITPGRKPAKRPVARKPVTRKPSSKSPVVAKPKVTARPRPKTRQPRPKVTTRPQTRPKTVTDPGPAVRPAGVRDSNPPARRANYKPLAALSFVVGAAAVAGGVVVGMKADEAAEDFNSSVFLEQKRGYKDDAENLALGANVLYGVGAAALLIGGLLWAMDDGGSTYGTVAPTPDGGAYVGLGGSF